MVSTSINSFFAIVIQCSNELFQNTKGSQQEVEVFFLKNMERSSSLVELYTYRNFTEKCFTYIFVEQFEEHLFHRTTFGGCF